MQRSAQAAPGRPGVRRLAPPRPLAALLAIVVLVGLAWAFTVAPWQSPDETTHFAYAQSLAESFTLPGVPGRPGMSSDQSAADNAVGASRGAFYPQSSPPDWSRSDYRSYLAQERGGSPPARNDGSGVLAADSNPPLYYLYADIGYLIDHGGTAFGRLYAIRVSGVLLLALTTVAAWLLAGEALGRRRLPQLACAAVAGLLPMETFMSTAINPDALLVTLWTFALWLGARVINHRARRWDVIALGAVTAAAILTKATAYALVPPVALALAVGWRRRAPGQRLAALGPITTGVIVLAAPVLGWVALTRSLGRAAINQVASSPAHPLRFTQFVSYVWQFYLPRLPFMSPLRPTPRLPAYEIWVVQGTGVFGWLDVYLPHWMYPAAGFTAAALAITCVVILARRLRGRRQLALLGFFALALLALLVLLHVTEYRVLVTGGGEFLQGRYLLPVIGLLGLAVGLVVSAIPARLRWRSLATGAVVTGLLAWQAVALAAVVEAFYL